MNSSQQHSAVTIKYMEQDQAAFKFILNSPHPGKLGVAAISNACAGFDLFAWLLYQRFDKKLNNKQLFTKLLSDNRFFKKRDFIDEHVFYGIVRCGVIHQFYPKGIDIIAIDRDDAFVSYNGTPHVNSIGFYRKVLEGLKKADQYVQNLTGDELDKADLRLALRIRMDEEAAGGNTLATAILPAV